MIRGLILLIVVLIVCTATLPVLALPSPDDQPEEVLRTQVILEARSPIDGTPMTAAEYAELQATTIEANREVGVVPAELRRLITLLRLRKALKTILPFLF